MRWLLFLPLTLVSLWSALKAKARPRPLTGQALGDARLRAVLAHAARGEDGASIVSRPIKLCCHCRQLPVDPDSNRPGSGLYCSECLETHRVQACPDHDCSLCAVLVCPHADLFHFHGDGCPSCFPPVRH